MAKLLLESGFSENWMTSITCTIRIIPTPMNQELKSSCMFNLAFVFAIFYSPELPFFSSHFLTLKR